MNAAPRAAMLPPNRFTALTETKRSARQAGIALVDLAEGDPDYPPDGRLLDRLAREMGRPNQHGYAAIAGGRSLRDAMAAHLASQFGVRDAGALSYLPGNGAKELVAYCCLAFGGRGRTVLVPEVHYPHYELAVALSESDLRTYPVVAGVPRLDLVADRDRERATLVIVNFPSNPTGETTSHAGLSTVVATARETGAVVCADAAYAHFGQDPHPEPSILAATSDHTDVVEVHSFSKSLGVPGWRASFVAGDPDVVACLSRLRSVTQTGPHVAFQKTFAYALEHFDELSASGRALIRERRATMVDALDGSALTVAHSGAGMFVWARLPSRWSGTAFATAALRYRSVAVVNGAVFGDRTDGHVRVSLTAPLTTLVHAAEALDELAAGPMHGLSAERQV